MNTSVPSIGARDSRTLLPDRDSFYRDVTPLVDDGETAVDSIVLLVIDVEGLDFILRTFGPDERDRVVQDVGKRIRDAARGQQTPYHINQDRFAVILTETSYKQATELATTIVEALRAPFNINGIAYHLDAHVGISHYPNHAQNLAELVRTGVFATYQARQVEHAYATFDHARDDEERQRFRLMLDLEEALDQERGIRLAYQPQVDLQTGKCMGVESLCRWEHPRLGPIPPGDFLPFVEQSPLMMPLTETTVAEGLESLSRWRAKGFAGSLAINLSTTLFRRVDMLDRLMEHFRYTSLDMEKVDFEVTETGIMDQPNRAVNMLNELRKGGAKIAVDDFGTGQSSLSYLADLPIDVIKIDKYFVQNMDKPWGRAIVGAATTLSNELNLLSIAEGIETEKQYIQCKELGVKVGQGFYIGHPMFRADFEQWMVGRCK